MLDPINPVPIQPTLVRSGVIGAVSMATYTVRDLRRRGRAPWRSVTRLRSWPDASDGNACARRVVARRTRADRGPGRPARTLGAAVVVPEGAEPGLHGGRP